MSKKFLWMDGIERDQSDPSWNQKKAQDLGLIPKAIVNGAIGSVSRISQAQLLHEHDCAHAQLTGSGNSSGSSQD